MNAIQEQEMHKLIDELADAITAHCYSSLATFKSTIACTDDVLLVVFANEDTLRELVTPTLVLSYKYIDTMFNVTDDDLYNPYYKRIVMYHITSVIEKALVKVIASLITCLSDEFKIKLTEQLTDSLTRELTDITSNCSRLMKKAMLSKVSHAEEYFDEQRLVSLKQCARNFSGFAAACSVVYKELCSKTSPADDLSPAVRRYLLTNNFSVLMAHLDYVLIDHKYIKTIETKKPDKYAAVCAYLIINGAINLIPKSKPNILCDFAPDQILKVEYYQEAAAIFAASLEKIMAMRDRYKHLSL